MVLDINTLWCLPTIAPLYVVVLFFNLHAHVLFLVQASAPEDVPPILAGPRHAVLSILRKKIFLVAISLQEGTFTPAAKENSLYCFLHVVYINRNLTILFLSLSLQFLPWQFLIFFTEL